VISLFRNNLLINSVLLLPYILVLRIKSFFLENPYIPTNGDSFFVKQYYNLFDSVISQAVANIIIIFINAILINRMVIKKNLSKENNLVAGLIYGLLNSLLLDLLPSSPALFASFFIILALQEIFNAYNNLKASDQIFMAGIYLSLATLIYWPCILFLIAGYMALAIIRSFKLVEQIQYVIGWIIPFFLIMSFQYFAQDSDLTIPAYFFSKVKLNIQYNLSLSQFISLIFALLMVVISILSYGIYTGRKVILGQKIFSILFWFMLFIGISALFYADIRLNHLHILFIPLSIFMMNNLIEFKNPIIAEMIHLVLILTLTIVHLDLVNLT
jgi:hypothetical protein